MKIGISSYSLSKAINKGEIDVFGLPKKTLLFQSKLLYPHLAKLTESLLRKIRILSGAEK